MPDMTERSLFPSEPLPPGLSPLPVPKLPPRPRDAHKGSFGSALVVAGSRNYPGAAVLAALGAGRAGAGLVRLALPEGLVPDVLPAVPFATVVRCPQTPAGGFSRDAADVLRDAAAGADAVVVGPGFGQEDDARALLVRLLRDAHVPLVLDADGLNLLARLGPDPLAARHAATTAATVLTPHPGEFARLTGLPKPGVGERVAQAARYSRQVGAIVVLKGSGSVVTDGTRAHVETAGNPGLATGGMGDVLAGAIGALLCLVPRDLPDAAGATALAVHAHALAGDRVAAELGEPAVLPEDVARALGKALAG